jgi:hypothetical protein
VTDLGTHLGRYVQEVFDPLLLDERGNRADQNATLRADALAKCWVSGRGRWRHAIPNRGDTAIRQGHHRSDATALNFSDREQSIGSA